MVKYKGKYQQQYHQKQYKSELIMVHNYCKHDFYAPHLQFFQYFLHSTNSYYLLVLLHLVEHSQHCDLLDKYDHS